MLGTLPVRISFDTVILNSCWLSGVLRFGRGLLTFTEEMEGTVIQDHKPKIYKPNSVLPSSYQRFG